MTHLLQYIIDNIERFGLRHEVHHFDSAAIMVDIWIEDNFHVVQIEKESIGLSLIPKDNTAFDTIPDLSFTDERQFKDEFAKILPQHQ